MSASFKIKKLGILLILALLLSPWIAGYAYAFMYPSTRQTSKNNISKYFYADRSWNIRETFSVDVYIFDAKDACAWQVELVYDPYSVVPLNVTAPDFSSLKTIVLNSSQPLEEINLDAKEILDYAILCFATDLAPGVMLLGGFRFDKQSLGSSEKVAIITFGVWSHASNDFNIQIRDILLLNVNLAKTDGGIAIGI